MSEVTTIQKENPLGTEPVGKLLLAFSVPSIIACLVNSVYNIVDQIFIGQGVGYLGNAGGSPHHQKPLADSRHQLHQFQLKTHIPPFPEIVA